MIISLFSLVRDSNWFLKRILKFDNKSLDPSQHLPAGMSPVDVEASNNEKCRAFKYILHIDTKCKCFPSISVA